MSFTIQERLRLFFEWGPVIQMAAAVTSAKTPGKKADAAADLAKFLALKTSTKLDDFAAEVFKNFAPVIAAVTEPGPPEKMVDALLGFSAYLATKTDTEVDDILAAKVRKMLLTSEGLEVVEYLTGIAKSSMESAFNAEQS